MKGHYLEITLSVGKAEVERAYIELQREDETVQEVVERWILGHPKMVDRIRNRAKVAAQLRERILYARIARPTSYYRQQAEREGQPFPTPVGSKVRRGSA